MNTYDPILRQCFPKDKTPPTGLIGERRLGSGFLLVLLLSGLSPVGTFSYADESAQEARLTEIKEILRPPEPVVEVAATPAATSEPLPDDVKNGLGCFLAGTGATATTVAAGSENIINVIAGGVVPVTSGAVLVVGVLGVVFASFCTIGQILTPALVYTTEKIMK